MELKKTKGVGCKKGGCCVLSTSSCGLHNVCCSFQMSNQLRQYQQLPFFQFVFLSIGDMIGITTTMHSRQGNSTRLFTNVKTRQHQEICLISCFGLMTDSTVVDSALVVSALRKFGLIYLPLILLQVDCTCTIKSYIGNDNYICINLLTSLSYAFRKLFLTSEVKWVGHLSPLCRLSMVSMEGRLASTCLELTVNTQLCHRQWVLCKTVFGEMRRTQPVTGTGNEVPPLAVMCPHFSEITVFRE